MENQQQPEVPNSLDNFFSISFDTQTRAQIKQAAQWAKICALCAFIGYGVSLVIAIFGTATSYSSTFGEEGYRVSTYSRGSTIATALISIVIGTLINLYLYRFSSATVQGMDSMDNLKTNDGFNNLRIYFKILGIILIIVLSIVALAMLILLLGAGLGRR